jgi:3-oxoacyl-[acyl-carrier-protein] synthase II
MLTMPEDFTAAVERCRGSDGKFDFKRWGAEGLPSMTPLWLLKYLPNMPASHIAIFNDLRGPSNSLTVREASGHIAAGEAAITIKRGAADVMLVGATGTRIHPMKMVHAILNEQVALGDDSPETWSRPFDRDRKGMVLGEGAAVLILEELQHAQNRNAQIYGEILGHAAASHVTGMAVGQRKSVVRSVTSRALASAGISSDALGHVHAQGLSTTEGDKEEYGGLRESLGETIDQLPLVSAKSNFGHLGAGSGLVECIASLLALQKNELFLHKNYETQDAECPIRAAIRGDTAGDSFLSFAATPQGQAGSLVFGRCPEGAIGAAS